QPNKSALPTLMTAFVNPRSETEMTRRLALKAIGKIGPDAVSTLPFLTETLCDKDLSANVLEEYGPALRGILGRQGAAGVVRELLNRPGNELLRDRLQYVLDQSQR